jgi:hypothetical protein
MTAYRQQALDCAAALRDGPKRPRDLRAIAPAAGSILLTNVYGWFERVERGIYRLGPLGDAALRTWLPELASPTLQSAASNGRRGNGVSRPDRRRVA